MENKLKNKFANNGSIMIETHEDDTEIYVNECMVVLNDENWMHFYNVLGDMIVIRDEEHYMVLDADDGLTHFWFDNTIANDIKAIKTIMDDVLSNQINFEYLKDQIRK